jgi:hypothetical protein
MESLVLMNIDQPRAPIDPRAPKPTEQQAGELVCDDARAFEQWASSRDLQRAVFGVAREAEGGRVGCGLSLIGSEHWQIGILAQIAKRLSKESRLIIGTRILLELEKEGYI